MDTSIVLIVGIGIGIALLVFVWNFIRGYMRGGKEKKSEVVEKPTQRKTPEKSGEVIKPLPKQSTESRETNIFISYRREDSADITGRIYDRLTQHFEPEAIFKDVDSIPLGVDFREHLEKHVQKCRVLLAVIGPDWSGIKDETGNKRLENPRDFVRIEIEAALRRSIPVIPLLVRGARMPNDQDLPMELKSLAYRNGIPVRPDPDFHRDVDRLIKGIEEQNP